jgi:hypothetical protein
MAKSRKTAQRQKSRPGDRSAAYRATKPRTAAKTRRAKKRVRVASMRAQSATSAIAQLRREIDRAVVILQAVPDSPQTRLTLERLKSWLGDLEGIATAQAEEPYDSEHHNPFSEDLPMAAESYNEEEEDDEASGGGHGSGGGGFD